MTRKWDFADISILIVSTSSWYPFQMFAMKSSLEDMDALELDFRMRLAEVQRRYKEKQRELVKLQRRRDSG